MVVEIGKKYPKIKWDEKTINGVDATFKWNEAPGKVTSPRYTWDEVELIQQAAGEDWQQWGDDKKKRLIKLICKVKGKTYKETKEVQDIEITAKDIKLLAEKVLGIEVLTENIKF